jgi:hypothetical protein
VEVHSKGICKEEKRERDKSELLVNIGLVIQTPTVPFLEGCFVCAQRQVY